MNRAIDFLVEILAWMLEISIYLGTIFLLGCAIILIIAFWSVVILCPILNFIAFYKNEKKETNNGK